ncbi:alpha subunit of gdp-forming succinate-CoA ligase [Emericellopsis atlantica]|uniref:Alpha subunit of gdp-forming succinate-CoA ligase n=1 Tax=Emericellopsis atlantica TaxID=2614577 RepID=A0A9P8CQC9_9HYPO|nr:alpha subunit of gdp-forming succinate-CoA ligase [Emericellopsis atlantica]KAG9255493.1 alpha subunit of gdp-forming succinate-CoA ligase [Emericellopsis atlantica]
MANGFAPRACSRGRDTIPNLRIGKGTKVIFQGFTGKAATANAKDTIAYGTNIAGGVSPGKGGQTHLDRPVFDSVREAVLAVKPDVSAVFVPAAFAAAAIIESIEAEMPLVVSVAEHIPVHDMLRVQEVLRTQTKTRLVGPNCPGIIAPEQCRVGIMPYKQYMRGCVGIVSKSGTLSYEAVGATTKIGLGQSLVMGMGGDMLPGTTLVDGLKTFFDHDETKGIIVIGEIGGEAELKAAALIKEYRRSTAHPKPIIAMVAGRTAPPGKTMGHAGAILQATEVSAEDKARALADAGVVVVPHPGVMGVKMEQLLRDQ